MKKLFVLVALFTLVLTSAYAKSFDYAAWESKQMTNLENRIQKIDNSRYKQERKDVLKKQAKETTDLKIKQKKELVALSAKPKATKKTTKKTTKSTK